MSRRTGLCAAMIMAFVLSFVAASSELQHAHRLSGGEPGGASSELTDANKLDGDAPRTATGGIIHSILVSLTVLSFIGNAVFLVNVFFWQSK